MGIVWKRIGIERGGGGGKSEGLFYFKFFIDFLSLIRIKIKYKEII